jgi:RNA recognition motif-containing protein
MSRGTYSQGKRRRESEKARKKKEKSERRSRRKERGPAEDEIVSAEEMTGALPTIAEAMQAHERLGEADRSSAAIPCRLFVGGLSWNTTQDMLRAAFADFGPVADCVIVTDRDTGSSRGFGFVTMADRKDATRAIKKLNEVELDGRNIVVNIATDRQR